MKKDMVLAAKTAFTNENCVRTLKAYMQSSGCPEIKVYERNFEIILRCEKPDEKRGQVWDQYWFRITPAALEIDFKQNPEVEQHTICIDSQHRIEAYPPE